MSLPKCPMQEICQHYTTGDNKPKNNDVRHKISCYKWITMECEKIGILAELQEYATGEVMACNLEKIRKIKRGLKK